MRGEDWKMVWEHGERRREVERELNRPNPQIYVQVTIMITHALAIIHVLGIAELSFNLCE